MRHGLRAARLWPGDYLVLPIGTTWRLDPAPDLPQRILYLEAPSEIEPPKRYRNDYGQLLEHSLYRSATSTRRTRSLPEPATSSSMSARRTGSPRITTGITRSTSWAGTVPWPFRSAHQGLPADHRAGPPRHPSTRRSRHCNFVVCSFVPRKFDYHPLGIPAPYNHSNINSDEVIYYVAGNFMSRRGVEIASFTLHPAGIPHGPHPGTVEASIGKESTEELAVMVDTSDLLRHAGRDGPGRPALPIFLAAARGCLRRGARAQRTRSRGVPRLTVRRPLVAPSTRCPAEPAHRPGPPGPWCGCVAAVGGRGCPNAEVPHHTPPGRAHSARRIDGHVDGGCGLGSRPHRCRWPAHALGASRGARATRSDRPDPFEAPTACGSARRWRDRSGIIWP